MGKKRKPLAPVVYDLVQVMAGAPILRRRLRRLLARMGGEVVLDLGGGTGWAFDLWWERPRCYTLLDIDLERVRGFRIRRSGVCGALGDARKLPIATGAADIVLCFLMAHHLDDQAVARLLAEGRRVLRPDGALLFLDPLWRPRWLPGRLLWFGDRGDYPRAREVLEELVSRRFRIELCEELTVLHRYLLIAARPQGGGRFGLAADPRHRDDGPP